MSRHDLAVQGARTIRPVSVRWPITAKSRSHLSKMARAASSRVRAQHHQHALLALRQHELVGVMPVSRAGTWSRSSSMPTPPLPAISTDGQVRPAAPMSWMATIASVCHQLQARLEQQLLGERIADLHGGPLRLGFVGELGRGHGRAVDAVAAGLRADIDHRIARRRRRAHRRCGPWRAMPTVIALTRMLPS